MITESAEVVIVGAGPSGLAAAAELRRAGAGSVVVIDRERAAGGIPRHAQHSGFGLRACIVRCPGPGTRRAGPRSRRRRARSCASERGRPAGRPTALELTGAAGRSAIRAQAVVLATGCRERPRSARLVAGTRPQGVMTTGMLQQLVYLAGERVGSRAVVVGAEHVSFSALLTLDHGGARTVAMTTELPRHQSFALFRAGAVARFRVPLLTRTAVTAIHGGARVEAVELTEGATGRVRRIDCDTVVFTADWIPDHELAVLAGAELDPGTRGPAVDSRLRTTRPGLFACGNLLHGAETADVAALGGRHVAAGVLDRLGGGAWPARISISCEEPLRWISPSAIGEVEGPASAPPRGATCCGRERSSAGSGSSSPRTAGCSQAGVSRASCRGARQRSRPVG